MEYLFLRTNRYIMKGIWLFVILWIFSQPVTLIADPADTLWTRTYGGGRDDVAYSVCSTNDGGFAIAGRWSPYVTFCLVKTDLSGNTIWTHTYGNDRENCYCVKQTIDNGYILAGYHLPGDGTSKCFVVKTDETGDSLWGNKYRFGSFLNEAYDVIETTDGGYIFVGYNGYLDNWNMGFKNIRIVKLDSGGDMLWACSYGSSDNQWDIAHSINYTNDGNFVIGGSTTTFCPPDNSNMFLMKINPEGDSLWIKTYGGHGKDYGKYALQTNDGGYIIAGETLSFSDCYDIYLVKTDTHGDTVWTRTYGGALNDYATSLALTEDNGYLITGYGESYGTGAEDLYLIQVDSLGNLVWTWTYGGINNERGYCIRKYDEECYIIAGYTGSFGAGGRDFWLLNFSEERTAINDDNIQLVKGPVLINNYPNPFNSTTNICYYLANDENISLSIYNLAGKRIETLINSYIQSGQHNITWDASGYSSGVYFYKLTTENQTFTKRMVLLK